MHIQRLAQTIDPIEFERYAARLIAGSEPLGQLGTALHILDRHGYPALVMCKHIHHGPADIFKLHHMMIRYNIARGYLVYPGSFSTATRNAAYYTVSSRITLINDVALEDLERLE